MRIMKLARTTGLAVAMAAAAAAAFALPATADASTMRPDGFPFPYPCGVNTSDFKYAPGTTYGSGTADCVGNYAYELFNQGDGNLVIYSDVNGANPTQAIWASNTDVGAAAYDVMQTDGNFVVYRQSNQTPLWSTKTNGHSGAYLCFQLDGNLVVYAAGGNCSGTALWSSRT